MSVGRPLRGACQCGRNRYIVQIPGDATETAQVMFETDQARCFPQANPLTAFLRVPLAWYRSTTYAFFPDESPSLIHRIYSHPRQEYAQRHFCGFCGTPIAFWSEQPRTEADYISLTLDSLHHEDLRDLEDMGLIPDPGEQPATPKSAAADNEVDEALRIGKASTGVTWFDDLMEGSALGTLRRTQAAARSADGRAKVEWEVVEWTEDGDASDVEMGSSATPATPVKRKLDDRDDFELATQG
ncbi:Mss4 [Zalerion maritima]|uniref:Mss4 n=1 Tax=Zalerion maritima TaxID=339359 RepID=A0AAD5WXK0_9PEZI|nr:Mss4 [Zalerion maritima]